MNENNKSFYPSNMFEFIYHPEYGCRDLKGLNLEESIYISLGIGALVDACFHGVITSTLYGPCVEHRFY
jgi:hypothetical protein